MKIKYKIAYTKTCIKVHWFFIKIYRREMDSLLSDGKIIVSKKLSRVDKLLNYHCVKIMQLEHRHIILLTL